MVSLTLCRFFDHPVLFKFSA